MNNNLLTWSYSPTLPPTSGTTYSITARVADAAGNLGTASAARSFVLDTTPPAAVAAITDVTDNVGAISRTVPTGGSTNDITPTITGTVSAALAAGVSLQIFSGATLLGSATVNNNSLTWGFTPTLPATSGVTYSITARLADGAGNLGTASAARTFVLDLPSITLAVSPTTVLEDGDSNLVYTFTRTGPTASSLSVNYTVAGTATLGVDYSGIAAAGTTKTVTFAAGSSTVLVTVDPIADNNPENSETVSLTVASGTGYTVGTTGAVVGTISDSGFTPGARTINGVNLGSTQLGFAIRPGAGAPIQVSISGQFASASNPGAGWSPLAAAATAGGYDRRSPVSWRRPPIQVPAGHHWPLQQLQAVMTSTGAIRYQGSMPAGT
ncbi:hypothetical protein L107_05168 [Cyanobium sp. Copco_Reservoir_LC18]|nr:hypothetical protein L107_05168 [Cyanobium sp. Copco_Reservoir_LC18]